MTEFCDAWIRKAELHNGTELPDYYNRAFTLFTTYNRLYAEATFTLARERKIRLPPDRFPDAKGAKKYAPQFIGYQALLNELQNDPDCSRSVQELIHLLETEVFHIKLSMPHGRPRRDKDLELLAGLKSADTETKISALMDIVYSVRCNMFHGNKRFDPVQVRLLEPVITILRKITDVLYDKLKTYQETA